MRPARRGEMNHDATMTLTPLMKGKSGIFLFCFLLLLCVGVFFV